MRGAALRFALCTAAAAASVLVSAAAQAGPAAQPDPGQGAPAGKLHFRGRAAAAGVGFAWGASRLEFQGQTYPVRVDGFVLGAVGTISIEGTGDVYGVTRAEDLNGDFTAVSTGLALGSGAGKLVMRNEKGVRVVLDTLLSGLSFGFGPRGITLAVGEAGGPPAEAGARLPQTLAFGEMQAGPLFLKPTLNAQMYAAFGANAGFGGDWSFGAVDEADDYFEHSNELGLNLRYPLGPEGEFGALHGRVSGVFSLTASGPDGPVCNDGRHTSDYTLEAGYLAWKSGNLIPQLGENAIELSGGNQNYQVFDGLLFWDGGQDCSGRGANWLSPRKAFEETGILRLQIKDLLLEGAHLKYNDQPDTGTRLGAARIEYATDDLFLEHLKVGFMYFDIYESDDPTRDDMDGVYLYHESTPFPFLKDFSLTSSFVREDFARASGLTHAWGWYVAPAYQISRLPWEPKLSYRYASFSGGATQAFDSLFTGLPDWGTWFQGELLGEYVLSNSNLISHQVRLTVTPSDVLTVNLIYYHYQLDDPDQDFGLVPGRVDHDLADEVDLILDLALTNWWSITASFAVASPNQGFKQAVGGSDTWFNGYLYLNFNF
jgi:hypothetical protein